MPTKGTCVHTAYGELDAQQVRAFLEANDNRCEFRGEALRNTHGLTLDGLGRVEVHVAPERVEEALELLARADAGELALDDSSDTTPDDPQNGN
jgi:hypothetical protein